jgi:hypothetical protein
MYPHPAQEKKERKKERKKKRQNPSSIAIPKL